MDERTVADWQRRAGQHCQQGQQAIVEHAHVSSAQGQADELRAKDRKLVIWMGLALDAPSRFWLAGGVRVNRARALADRGLQQVRRGCPCVRGRLICTDGGQASPKSILRAVREKVQSTAGRGRCRLEVWPELGMATISKHTQNTRVVEVTRTITRGPLEKAPALLEKTLACQPSRRP